MEQIKTFSVKCVQSQYEFIKSVVERVAKQQQCSNARALEMIVADYNAGSPN